MVPLHHRLFAIFSCGYRLSLLCLLRAVAAILCFAAELSPQPAHLHETDKIQYTPLPTQPPQLSSGFPPFPSQFAPIIAVSSVLLRL